MKAIIVCAGTPEGNTRKVADAIGTTLDARVVAPDEVGVGSLAGHDVVGFGSGIFWQRFHPELRRLVRSLARADRGHAFVFATSGLPEFPLLSYTRSMRRLLRRKGFEVHDGFVCRGKDTWGPFKLVGGIHKQRPDGTDLAAARTFARRVRERVQAASES